MASSALRCILKALRISFALQVDLLFLSELQVLHDISSLVSSCSDCSVPITLVPEDASREPVHASEPIAKLDHVCAAMPVEELVVGWEF